MAKLTTCKHCGQEIAASAKMCPHCGGKNKKSIYKKWWFWLIIIVAGIGAISGNGGSSKKEDKKVGEVESVQPVEAEVSEGTEETAEPAEEEPAEEVQTVYKVGDILHDGDMDIVYVASGEHKENNEFLQPADGKKYIFLDLAFLNTSETADTRISLFSFTCYADGYACDAYYGGEDNLNATLSAGRSTEGKVYFEIPADSKEIEVEYETNYFTEEKITFTYEGDKDSGYQLEKDTSATTGAIKVGEKFESDGMIITFLSCKKDKSNNQFIKPKSGCHYVTCEFEFENLSDSDTNVSCYSFDCFADGAACDGAYFREDNLSATLSAGRKAKGAVTFEVPDGAEVVEFEYLDNIWTSDRVVFDAAVK